MKLVVSSKYLFQSLSNVKGIIPKTPLLPILENFLFQLHGNILTATGSDMQTSISVQVDVEGLKDGEITLNAGLLFRILKNIPDQPLTIILNSHTNCVEFFTTNGSFKILGDDARNYIKLTTIPAGQSIDFTSSALSSAISNTIYATSTDELRPSMTGVFLQLGAESATFVATDGYRMVRYRRSDITIDRGEQIILRPELIKVLKRILPKGDTIVRANFCDKTCSFCFDGITIYSKGIDGRYPDYEKAIPVDNPFTLKLSRAILLETIRRISFCANSATKQLLVKVSRDHMVLSVDNDYCSAREKLPCEYDGEDLTIAFNIKLLQDLISKISSEEVVFQIDNENKACLLLPTSQSENEDILMLLMPIRYKI